MAKALVTATCGIVCGFGLLSASLESHAQSRLYNLLRSRNNVAELDLSAAQQRRIDDLRRQLSERKAAMRKSIDDFERFTQERVMAVLSRRQARRLSQLYYQSRGPRALEESATAKELGLSDEQSKQILAIREAARQEYRQNRNDYRNIIKERDEKYLKVLTPVQQARWKQMLGPPRTEILSLTSEQQRELWNYLRQISPLGNDKYAEELKLTDSQKERIKELSRELRLSNAELQKIRTRYSDRHALARDVERKQKIQREMAEAVEEFYKRGVKKVFAVLTSRQRERLAKLRERIAQRRYQYRGTRSLPSADIADQLGLTKTQLEKMQAFREAARQAEAKEQRESRERIKRIREDRDQNYLDLLTPEQRAKWEKMLGRPLKRRKPDV